MRCVLVINRYFSFIFYFEVCQIFSNQKRDPYQNILSIFVRISSLNMDQHPGGCIFQQRMYNLGNKKISHNRSSVHLPTNNQNILTSLIYAEFIWFILIIVILYHIKYRIYFIAPCIDIELILHSLKDTVALLDGLLQQPILWSCWLSWSWKKLRGLRGCKLSYHPNKNH